MAPGMFVGELREYLGRWDKASKPARDKMLAEFVRHSRHMTGPELEREFGNGASLLLTRICAFLKTRVHAGDASIGTALQALAVFLGAASGHRFLLEFLDTGGLQMTIQMLTNKKIAEAERIRALQLLASIANSGFTYKQMICKDFHGEDAVLGFMCEASSESAHELIRSVLIGLGRGNNKVDDMQRKLIRCLRHDEALVQKTASQVLRQFLSPAAVEGVTAVRPDVALVDSVNTLFGSPNVYVLYEAQELAMTALTEIETRQYMIDSMVKMLQPPEYAYERPVATPADEDLYSGASSAAKSYFDSAETVPPEVVLQQVASCRLTGSFLKNKEERRRAAREDVCERMIDAGIMAGLLVAMANTRYSESKKHAVEAIKTITHLSNRAISAFKELTGSEFYSKFQLDSNGKCAEFDMAELQKLLKDTGNTHVIIKHAAREELVQSRSKPGDEEEVAIEEAADVGGGGGDQGGEEDGALALEEETDEGGGEPGDGKGRRQNAREEDKSATADEKESS